MREIQLSQGKVALVDDEDFGALSKHKWSALRRARSWHAVRRTADRYIYMHREIIGADCPREVDHADGNGLNNQRANLRAATRGNNMHNCGKRDLKSATSQFKGVCWDRRAGKWHAQSSVNYKNHHIGLFANEVAAAIAYDHFARHHHGAYARPNFPYGAG